MAKFYLLNTTMIGTTKYFAGDRIDDAVDPKASIEAAGGVCWTDADAIVSAAGLLVQSRRKHRAIKEDLAESLMFSAASKSLRSVQDADEAALKIGAALPAYVSNDSIPLSITHNAVYDVPTTGAASTITLPASAPTGTRAYFLADGVKNGHTVQYRDATGPTNLTAALTLSKRHLAVAVKLATAWAVTVAVAP